jgi:hypothetical protein
MLYKFFFFFFFFFYMVLMVLMVLCINLEQKPYQVQYHQYQVCNFVQVTSCRIDVHPLM